MANAGPNDGGTFGNDTSVGVLAVGWTSPGKAGLSDNQRAYSYSFTTGISCYLKATNFGFSLPSAATIKGIKVGIEKRTSTAVAGGAVYDSNIKIVKGGAISGDNKASTATKWSTAGDVYVNYGSSVDLWGLAWKSSDINKNDFGVGVSARTHYTADIDHIRITVYYQPFSFKSFMGISTTAIARIDGIPIENISKVNGV